MADNKTKTNDDEITDEMLGELSNGKGDDGDE